MQITVNFWSYFADITGTRQRTLELPEASTVESAVDIIYQSYPTLATARKCTLIAVGVDYAPSDQVLHPNDELSFFPPVQGG